MSIFFTKRPIFAWVIAIVMMLAGYLAIQTLPIAQYPEISPPTISVSATYPGADAETLENSVTKILEQQLTGIDGMLYFSSSSSSSGSASISVTFNQGVDADTAQQQVQNKIQQAISRLPNSVQQQGVSVKKSNSDFLMVIAVYDKLGKHTNVDISDYLSSNISDPLSRVNGVGDVNVFGSEYAMRVWLDPVKLASYKLMPSDVSNAIREQNTQVSAGQIGSQPTPADQQLTAVITAQSLLQTPEEFRNIVIKSNNDGADVLLGEVARVELGSEGYGVSTRLNGYPSSGIAIMLAPGANALDTSKGVKARLDEIKESFPEGFEIGYARDNTDFIQLSIDEVFKTLMEAILLVVIVMFLFLQDWRATIIPTITVPVVLLGTFGVFSVLGYSINTLTMFGLVLSIGLLVDDTIVVVENVERVMREEGLSPKEATIKTMHEISGALVGIATVLSAVFIPMAFFGGSIGVIYKQFSVSIVTAMILSILVALILTPALCATFLKPHKAGKEKGFFHLFNKGYDRLQSRYDNGVTRVLRRPIISMIIYGLIVVAMYGLFQHSRSGFLPGEDQGSVMVQYTLPSGAIKSRTDNVGEQIENYFMDKESDNVKYIFTISGFGFSGSGQNTGLAFVALNDWDQRTEDKDSSESIASRAMMNLSSIKDASIFAMTPPAISGLGQTGGFTFELQSAGSTDRNRLKEIRDEIITKANQTGKLVGVRSSQLASSAQINVEIDHQKAGSQGVSMSDINSTLSAAFGSSYVNDFLNNGNIKRVYIQGDGQFRSEPENIKDWYVRNSNGNMVPFSSFATYEWSYGPQSLSRYNGLNSYSIQGSPAPGVSSGEAMNLIVQIVNEYDEATYSWSGLSYEENTSNSNKSMLYIASLVFVFLCLAALYESWSVPVSVLMVIPLGIIGALLAVISRGLVNDVYFQIALLATMGLSAKNAILIVEFAEAYYKETGNLVESAIHASKMRLRPIIMTSLAFMAGIIPLALASGAGANSRISIGTGILGGTFSATILSVFFVPVFYVVVKKIFGYRFNRKNIKS